MEIDELVEVSHFAGSDLTLVQGGGGNASIKSPDNKRMWIKASGYRMSDVRQGSAYVETDLPALLSATFQSSLESCSPRTAHEEFMHLVRLATVNYIKDRPSLETGFHAVLERVVLHTHPVYVNAFTCMRDGLEALSEIWKEPFAWVPYAAPGYAITVKVVEACEEFQRKHGHRPRHILLANHGLIVSADTGRQTMTGTQELVDAARKYFGPACSPEARVAVPPQLAGWAEELQTALQARSRSLVVRASSRECLLNVCDSPDLAGAGPLVPDDVVYNGDRLWRVDTLESADKWLARIDDALPHKMIILVAGLGTVLVGPNHNMLDAMEEGFAAHVLIRSLIARRGHVLELPAEEMNYLLSMESEAHRQSVAQRRD